MTHPECCRIPRSYVHAEWRATTPVDETSNAIGIAFDVQRGRSLRLQIDVECARNLLASLAEYMHAHDGSRSHSDRSSGMPNSEVSTDSPS